MIPINIPSLLLESTPKEKSKPKIDQEILIRWLLEDGCHFVSWPVSNSYRRRFWKVVIGFLEGHDSASDDGSGNGEGVEVDERIYEEYIGLLSDSKVNDSLRMMTGMYFDEASLVIPTLAPLKHLKIVI